MMSDLRIGSLFSGYGGLDLAIAGVLDAETVFVADVCKVDKDGSVGHYEPHRSPCSILAHRFPGAPNLGDVSLIDWSPWRGLIDVLCAGFPCQDVSVAGGRAGLRDGTRTGLWSQVGRAITELQPRLVVLENVPGIFTASASGDVEPCPVCLGDGSGEHLRALDAVLADLAAIGFDADWTVVPASGVGAAHKRERWFCAAYPAGEPWSFEHGDAGQGGRGRRSSQLRGLPVDATGSGEGHGAVA
jgi:DNA (cytosine-5)-methyltransferase 1